MKSYKKIIITVISVVFSLSVYGQYTGPNSIDKLYTVKEVKENASRLDKSDELVKLRGFVIRQINSEMYEFRDNTDKILAEIDRKRLPAQPFNDKTEVIIIAEVDHDLLEEVEIEVKEIQIVKP